MAANEPVASHSESGCGLGPVIRDRFAAFFDLVALLPTVHGAPVRWWALAVVTAFAAVALLAPCLPHPLNRLWFAFGLALHHVVNPVIMAVMFYGAVLPMAVLCSRSARTSCTSSEILPPRVIGLRANLRHRRPSP